ncbi:efflux RND transporter periplasmic adaptor subunit [Xanthobacteraceae bacterium Astr-EGSB]|uniref:efflux RND transporter periplasmic adaptor subunit n=1 Tax=Astrobacterium formosum TaxID=3069710 RepID=UPI0027B0A715|nr:efflux RND transporter periplasmic adaptor subunit [Xanthobacteraceae bacterium Astr-EGSB]
MKKRWVWVAVIAAITVGGATLSTRWFEKADRGSAQANQDRQVRTVAVLVGQAVRKQTPVRIEALGSVTPIANVAIKSRVDNEIVGVHFADGALVNKGDLLVTLDSRAISAQVAQAEGTVARDQAQLEGAQRDVRRYTELVEKNATPTVNLDNAKTQVATYSASIKANSAALDNLKVLLSYYSIKAPISGRISAAAVKVGNFVRAADLQPIATIIQLSPIYVSFTVPQRFLPDIRQALANESASVDVMVPGSDKHASGVVTMIENTIDSATGTATIRATMPNQDELLWPGTLVNVSLTIRDEDAVSVPTAAVQVSQQGTYVFVVSNGVAQVRPVTVSRAVGQESVIADGLNGGETVVTDGHLQLTNNVRVTVREGGARS